MKKLFICVLIGAVGFVGAKTYEHSQKDYSNDLLLQNVEALSEGEESPSCPGGHTQYKIDKPWPWSDRSRFNFCTGTDCVEREGYNPEGSC